MRARLVVVAILAGVPLAQGALVSGELDLSDAITLPAPVVTGIEPVAIFATVPSEIEAGRADLPRASVRVLERSYVKAALGVGTPEVVLGTSERSWSLSSVRVAVEGRNAGWIGLHPESGETAEGSATARLYAVVDDLVGNADGSMADDGPTNPYYRVTIDGPAVAREMTTVRFTGAGALKLLGPAVTLEAEENTTKIETGEMPDPEEPGRTVLRWLQIDFGEGSVSLEGIETEVVTRQARAEWTGTAVLGRAEGALEGSGERWEARRERVTIDGTFIADIMPASEGRALRASLSGDLVSSTLSGQVLAPTTSVPNPLLPVVLVLGGLATVGGASYLLYRRRAGARPSHDVELIVARAEAAADAEDFATAASWAEKARKVSPTSKRLALDHAYFLSASGNDRRAADILDGPLLRGDPDASLLLARIWLSEAREDEAANALIRGLEASPLMLMDLEGDAALRRVLERAEVRQAIRRARRRLD